MNNGIRQTRQGYYLFGRRSFSLSTTPPPLLKPSSSSFFWPSTFVHFTFNEKNGVLRERERERGASSSSPLYLDNIKGSRQSSGALVSFSEKCFPLNASGSYFFILLLLPRSSLCHLLLLLLFSFDKLTATSCVGERHAPSGYFMLAVWEPFPSRRR